MIALMIALSVPSFAGHGEREGDRGHAGKAQHVEAQVLELAENDPELAAELEELKAEDPHAYRQALLRVYREELHERDPEEQRLRAEEKALRARMRVLMLELEQLEEGSREHDKKLDDIRELAGQVFDLRTQGHELKVARLEERLEGAKAELAEREASRDELIEAWVEDKTSSE
jgi:competence protein ComGC